MSETDCIFKQGEIVVGLKQVIKGILKKEIDTVFLATDCDGFIENKLLAASKDLKTIKRYTGKQLGRACNIDVDAAVVGIIAVDSKQ